MRTALEGTPDPVVDTAELLLGELATNAVLHAGTEFEVSVSATDGRVRVQVGDRQPDRPPLPPGTCAGAGTGLGLVMVEELASRYGVRSGEEHKTVWFDLGDGPAPWAPSTWESARPPSGPHTTVALVDLPHALYTACRMRRHALLRELALATPPGRAAGVSTRDALTAHETSTRVTAWLAAALETQQPASDIRSVRIAVPSDAAPAVDTLRRVLERTEEAARDGRLLARPSFTHHRDFHTWLFDQIVRQLDGEDPTAWTVVPREPGATPAQLAPWEAGQVRDSRTPTIAADEDNRIIAANDAAADMLGWYAEELVGQRLTVLIPQHLWGRHLAAFGSLLLTGMPRIMGRSVPLPAQHRDGELVPVRLLIQPQETAEGETVFVAQLTPRAATPYSHAPERKRAPFPQEPAGVPAREPVSASTGGDEDAYKLERLALLADTRSALSGTADLREGLRRVCLVLTQRLADWCVLDLVDEHGRVERACVVHRDPQRVPFDIRTGALPSVSEEAQGALARVLRGAGPLLLTDASEAGPARNALDARHLELFQRMGANSAVVAPLRARQEIMGAVTVARTGGAEPFTGEDLPLVDDLVRNLALGVDNVRLYQTTQDIAERLQHSLLPVLPDVPHLRMAARYAPLLRHRAGRRRLVRQLRGAQRQYGTGHRGRGGTRSGGGDRHEPAAQHAPRYRHRPPGAPGDGTAPAGHRPPQSVSGGHRDLRVRRGERAGRGHLGAEALLRRAPAAAADHLRGRDPLSGGRRGTAARCGPRSAPARRPGPGARRRDRPAVHGRAHRTPRRLPRRRHGAAA